MIYNTRDYPTLCSVVGFASSLSSGGVSNGFAPPGLWTKASSLVFLSNSRTPSGLISNILIQSFPLVLDIPSFPIALLPTCHISTIYNNVYRPLTLFIFHRQLYMCEICHDVQPFFCSVFLIFYDYHTRKYIIVTILIEF